MAYTTIKKPTDYFRTKLYTGNGAVRSITFDESGNMQPDLIWLKSRTTTASWLSNDAVRGATKRLKLDMNSAESTETGMITSFDTNGFSLGTTGTSNANGETFVAFNWKANGAGSSNSDGSINSTVSANTVSGMSIVKFTGTGSAGTVGHGLGAVPKMIIIRNYDEGANWNVYHHKLPTGAAGQGSYLTLNDTSSYSDSSTMWNNTAPTSSVFSVGGVGDVNTNGSKSIAYCFADKTGYSKFDSWVSNNNANGTFVYTGFAPSFVMLKEYDGTNQWVMYDNKRPGYNQTSNALFANGTSVEATDLGVDLLSNGYKIRATNNQNSGNYIYMAFGQSLVGSNNVPCSGR